MNQHYKQCEDCAEIFGNDLPCACEPGAGPAAIVCVYCHTDTYPLTHTVEGPMCMFCYHHGDESALYAALKPL